ncbi:hypothetical protein ACFQ4L_07970 [Lapidilactobacillus mulanensis]|uniref:Uncharacterized protein n=1 Tax=Lapidilactobacillus mulanensis TaxID=2485999 RepID=A0ABW4DMV0_9LACO|nr:hypothetical protein [Lapidilactobacillus mulanensis]
MTVDYQEKLNELMAGKVAEVTVSAADFDAFHRVWQDLPQRKEIVGNAQRNGTVIYRYTESV